MRPPVRLYLVLAASLVLFTFSLSWSRGMHHAALAGRFAQGAAEAAARPDTSAATEKARANQGAGASRQSVPPDPRQGETVSRSGSGRRAPVPPDAGSTAVHTVQTGDTLTHIARLYGVPVGTITAANSLVSDQIRAGDRLAIPGAQPLRSHTVQQGDTMWELGSRYGIGIAALLAANRNVDAGHLQIGQVLLVPSGGELQAAAAASNETELSLGGLFTWPVIAPVSSQFGPRWGRNHAGIDLAANHGDPIRAARDGEVLLAGTVEGYGETVVLKHPDGTRTLYAHASKLLVRAGQRVKQGELIAQVGSTGQSTGPHLHFEVIVNDRPRDPMRILPPR